MRNGTEPLRLRKEAKDLNNNEAKSRNFEYRTHLSMPGILLIPCSTYVSPSAVSSTAAVMAVAGLELPVTPPI